MKVGVEYYDSMWNKNVSFKKRGKNLKTGHAYPLHRNKLCSCWKVSLMSEHRDSHLDIKVVSSVY